MLLIKASRYTKAWCALPVQSQCLLKSENLTTFDDGSLTSVEERVMGSNNSVWAEDLSLLRFVVSLCTNILQWSVIGLLEDLEESWQRTLDHHSLNMSRYKVTSTGLFWNCESKILNMQTTDSGGHVCRNIAETTSERRRWAKPRGSASRGDDYLKLVLVMQAGWWRWWRGWCWCGWWS